MAKNQNGHLAHDTSHSTDGFLFTKVIYSSHSGTNHIFHHSYGLHFAYRSFKPSRVSIFLTPVFIRPLRALLSAFVILYWIF